MAIVTPSMQDAARAAMAIAAAHGLAVQRLDPIGGYANFMFRLEPFAIVARVAGSAGVVRDGDGWLAREVAIADHLDRSGVPVVRPWRGFSPGPHAHEGHYLTFWEYVDVVPDAVSPALLGHALHDLHRALETYPEDLPTLGPLEEALAILDRPETLAQFTADDRPIIARTTDAVRASLSVEPLNVRPLHGDAHHGNLWLTDRGLIWGDFEDAHLGPIEWDLACMTASSRVFGHGTAAACALDAYAEGYDSRLLDLLITARTLQAIAWAAITLADAASNARVRKRLAWLAGWQQDGV